MTIIARVSATLVALSVSATLALAHDFKLGNLEITHPWARATLSGQPVAGGYMKITNKGAEPDRLIKITADVSGNIKVHDMKVEDGVMKMGEIPGGLEIAPGATVEMKPGGLHVMFKGIKEPFREGETVRANLTFEKAGSIDVEFTVDAMTAGGDGQKHHQTQ